MASFYEFERKPYVEIDRRAGIGPHHLSIGKTRKLFAHGNRIYAFFSTGFEIAYAILDRASREVLARYVVPANAAFGGAQFCIDDDGAGGLALLYVERGRDLAVALTGKARPDTLEWSTQETVFRAPAPIYAAPWIAYGLDGELWASVVGRDMSRTAVAYRAPGKSWSAAPLLQTNETRWHPSCVQMLPVARGRALALGFKGEFPARTELVAREFDARLTPSECTSVAPCNVNDQLTFHFQALGDPKRGEAHVAYLDHGLATSVAIWRGGEWLTDRDVFGEPSFAPQLTLGAEGGLALLVCDYDGKIWHSSRARGGAWTKPVPVAGAPSIPISPAFGRTGYGTGGLISAARSDDFDCLYLAGVNGEHSEDPSTLVLGAAFADGALRFSGGVSANLGKSLLEVTCSLTAIDTSALVHKPAWLVRIAGADDGEIVSIAHANTKSGTLIADAWCRTGDSVIQIAEHIAVRTSPRTAFDGKTGAAEIAWRVELPKEFSLAAPLNVSVRSYCEATASGPEVMGALVDLAPYAAEPNAIVARDPKRLPQVFKRLI